MNKKYLWSNFSKAYSYFHNSRRCLSYPEVFAIEVTNACIMDCRMCPRKHMKRKVGFMEFELFKKIVDQMEGYTEWVWLHEMGDPLLHPQLGKMIEYARKKGIKTRLSTNPVMLNEKNCRMILDSGLDLLHIALDGLNQETYSYIRGKNADYKKALEGIERFLKMKKKMKKIMPLVRVGIIKMKKTEKQIPEFIKKWSREDVNKIQVKEYKTFDGSQREIVNFAGVKNFSKEFKENDSVCRTPWFNIVILWDGKVVPCCNDYDGKYVLGDLKKDNLSFIWNSKQARVLRDQSIKGVFPKGHLCYQCREKQGVPVSSLNKLYPFNPTILNLVYKGFLRKFTDLKVEMERKRIRLSE